MYLQTQAKSQKHVLQETGLENWSRRENAVILHEIALRVFCSKKSAKKHSHQGVFLKTYWKDAAPAETFLKLQINA